MSTSKYILLNDNCLIRVFFLLLLQVDTKMADHDTFGLFFIIEL